MNVVLISPLIQECNYIGDYSSRWPQLGLAYIASTLEKAGHKVRIMERKIYAGPTYPKSPLRLSQIDDMMLSDLNDLNPGIIGLTATTPVIMDAFHTAKIIKENFRNLAIVIGGRHATTEPGLTLEQCPQIDIVCRGEGEYTMLDLANGLLLKEIKGITYRNNNGGYIINPDRALFENLDLLAYPAWHLLDQDFYFRPNIAVMRGDYMITGTIMTSRGCPYRCAFCQSPELLDIYGKNYIRFHSPERVINEIEYLMEKFGVKGISLNDDMFSLDKKRVIEICNRIIERKINKHLKFTVNLRSDRVDDEILIALKRAGCIHVIYGSESGSQATLKRMNKGVSIQKNIEAIRLTKKHGLCAEANIVIGSPAETEQDFLETIKFLKKAAPDRIFISKFYPLPGTQFYKNVIENKLMSRQVNWDKINDLYVENDDFTFADISPRKFIWLRNKLAREIVVFTNTLYVIKSNFKRNKRLVLDQSIKFFLYIIFLHLPISAQKSLKGLFNKKNKKIRYFFRG
ncbi:MAG: radical SAM protein [Candidatus Omnitrophica bacterium]|nr:radical SAM protein [Candidatus Omnitrophota bacterium]